MRSNCWAAVAFIVVTLLAEPLAAQPASTLQFCAKVKDQVQGVDPALASHGRIFIGGEELIAIKPSKDRKQVLISDGISRWWVPRGSVKLVKQAECQLPQTSASPASAPPASKPWLLFVEAGVGGELGSSAYSQFITDVPNPSQVEGLQDPIILKVEPGSSLRLGAGVLIPHSETLRWRGALSYQKLTFSMPAKINPADSSPIRLDERASTKVEVEHTMWSIEGGVEYDLPIVLHPSAQGFVGFSATINYAPEQAEITVRTGTIFKATETKITGGPKGVDFGLVGSAGLVFWDQVRVQLELNQEAAWGLRAGYQWQF